MRKIAKYMLHGGRRLLWRIMDSGSIRVTTKEGDSRQIRLLGNALGKDRRNGCPGGGRTHENFVFYLKINRDAPYTLDCIQMWLDIIQALGADYYFVCDNKWLEHKVMKSCIFRDLDIKFISSFRKNKIHKANYLYTGFWRNATYAHLTPFYHAKQNGIAKFWSIDADDTFLLMKAERTAKALMQVKDYVDSEEMDIVSLDMWLSRTFGQHWSFGVTYVDTTRTDFIDIFENISSSDWMDNYNEIEEVFNLDWFITYLRDKTNLKAGSFYVDNCWFVHFGDVIGNPIYGWVNYWRAGQIHYPILEHVYNNREIGCLPICDEAEMIDVGASEEEGMKLLENRISKSRYFKEQQRRLFKNAAFANDGDYFRR